MNKKEVEILLKLKDEMSDALKKADREIDRLGQNADTTSRKTERLGNKSKSGFGKAATAVAALGTAWVTSNVIGYASRAVEEYSKFEQRLVDISTLIEQDSAQSVRALSNGIDELIETVPKSAEELGASAYDIVSAGFQDTSDALKILEESSKLAVAGLGDTKEATDIMTSALNAFELEADDSDRVANSLFETVKNGKTTVSELARSFGTTAPTFAAANFQLEDYLAATAALTTTGLSASEAQTSLRQAVSNMIKPTKAMQELFDHIGVESLQQMTDQGMNMGEIFHELASAAEDTGINIADAFGSVESFNAVASVSGNQNKAYKDTLEDLTNESDSVKDAFDKQADSAKNTAQIQENRTNKAMREFWEEILPVKQAWNDFTTELEIGALETATAVAKAFGDLSTKLFPEDEGFVNSLNQRLQEDFLKNADVSEEAKEVIKSNFNDINQSVLTTDEQIRRTQDTIKQFSELGAWDLTKEEMRAIRQLAFENGLEMSQLKNTSKAELEEIANAVDNPIEKYNKMQDVVRGVRDRTRENIDALNSYVATVMERVPQATGQFAELRNTASEAIIAGAGTLTGAAAPQSRSTGGAVQAGRPYVVGETGPELFIAPSNGRIESQRTVNNNTNNASVSININGGDRSMVMQAVQEGLRRAGLTANAQLNTLNGLNNTRF